jgi:hypothetical protein
MMVTQHSSITLLKISSLSKQVLRRLIQFGRESHVGDPAVNSDKALTFHRALSSRLNLYSVNTGDSMEVA